MDLTGLSIVVITSPGREAQLERCLDRLSQQNWQGFEVLVIDDGSAGSEAVCRGFLNQLSLRYHWRPTDQCPARSRNLGASLARYAGLVFLDGDMLLNTQALGCYAACLNQAPDAAVYGYTGNTPHISCSLWYPDLPVLIYDSRFCFVNAERMVSPPELMIYPQRYAWSGNFAVSAIRFYSVGGFDESFNGWGYEDIDFARRLAESGVRLDFCLDAWAEHQLNQGEHDQHWHQTARPEQEQRAEITEPAEQTPHVLYQAPFSRLGELLAQHYLPQIQNKPHFWQAESTG